MHKAIMSPKERVQAALDHREPDRIPLDLGSTKMTGISITAYKRFLIYKGWQSLDSDPEILDPIQQLSLIREDVLEKLGVDVRGVLPAVPSCCKPIIQKTGNYVSFTDEWGIGWKKPVDHGFYFDMSSHPMAGGLGESILRSYKWPDPANEERTAMFPAYIADLKTRGEYAFAMSGVCSGILEMALRLRGFEPLLMDLAHDPGSVCGLLDRIVEIKEAYWEKALDQAGTDTLIAIEADDLGTQNSLLISPEMYRRYVKPRHKRLVSSIKRKAPHIKVFLHSCGAIKPLLPDFIEAGIDILNPVQVSSSNMETKSLKKEFGNELVFWGGGVDTQNVLPHGTPHEVREEIKRRIDDLGPGGGFIFNAVHNIQADVPPENIEAMLDALDRYGGY